MKIALYNHHHLLPFWHHPKQPVILFDAKVMGAWKSKRNPTTIAVELDWLWPVLLGLSALDIQAMAHVSVCFDKATETYEIPKRVWVQITTLPSRTDANGIPLVVEKEEVLVDHLWGGDNGTYSPNELLEDKEDPRRHDYDFWADFFLEKLRETKAKREDKARVATEEAALYAVIPA